MKIDILTLFPEAFSPLKTSILSRAEETGILEFNIVNIRDFSKDKHKKCDDYPFGGGAGMLMTVQPLFDAISSVYQEKEKTKIIFPAPVGSVFSAEKAEELSKNEHLIFVCGHYEGVDERIFELFPIEQISIGDYVLTGGELPAMVMIDCISRFVDGVIAKESLENESFSNGLLEYPQYTRPQEFMGLSVPHVLVSGNHAEVDKWKMEQSLQRTKERRADLIRNKKQ
ncbi:MAG: tRNA (guanosine(37)-N1)-methyltransferase TrmD [Clostridia bacterium]|nr:tRNA (guanosine(37)-N1)-methyltransferase TrmD [Clostridia bacterium]